MVRRITGASLGTFFRENVAGPLGADFHIGLDPAHFGRTGMGVRHGIGYGLSGFFAEHAPKDIKMCFWGGAGGSTILLDHTKPRLPVLRHEPSYVMNQMDMDMLGDQRGARMTERFYEGLGSTRAAVSH